MRFLICSDGSKQAENAVRFGGLMAGACQAEVTLLGIVEHPGVQELLLNALRRGQQLLQERRLDVEVITRSGEPVAEILKQTSHTAYDMVVIGAVHKGAKGAYWKSAKAYKVIKVLALPVLVVIGHPQQLSRILICTGGTPEANKAIQFAGRIAQASHAGVTLVHVFAQPPALYADLIARLEDVDTILKSGFGLARVIMRQKESLDAMGVSNQVKFRHGPVVWELLAELHEGNYDLIVTGFATSPGPFRSYLLGDVTRELINRAECPVLVVRGSQRPNVPEGIAGLMARLRNLITPSK